MLRWRKDSLTTFLLMCGDSNLYLLSGCLMWRNKNKARHMVWRVWRKCRDFPVPVLQQIIGVKMVMCHVLKQWNIAAAVVVFDKAQVALLTEVQGGTTWPNPSLSQEKTLHDNIRERHCTLWCFLSGLCGCVHDWSVVRISESNAWSAPSPQLINWNLKWITACIWQADLHSVCVESTLHGPSSPFIYWECEHTSKWYSFCCNCHVCHAVVFLAHGMNMRQVTFFCLFGCQVHYCEDCHLHPFASQSTDLDIVYKTC